MISVASLLNPAPSADNKTNQRRPMSTPAPHSPAASSLSQAQKTMRTPNPEVPTKAVLGVDKTRFQPHEYQDALIAAEHRRFRVEPIGRIRDNPRHIPYRSDKKTFQQKTGRDAFEAYHYTFRMPTDDPQREPHVIMWDYNVGLVRITALFKSLRHAKTMPAKVMAANPGLREISHSITGGAIAAQGYWMPYEAAKAVAATFCHEIRYVLTPVFGLDFPNTCIDPADPAFQRPTIDPEIVTFCKNEAAWQQEQQTQGSARSTPLAPTRREQLSQWTPRSIRSSPTDDEDAWSPSGCVTPIEPSPVTSTGMWNPVNIPRSVTQDQLQIPTPQTTPEIAGKALSGSRKLTRTRKRPITRESRTPESDYLPSMSLHKRKKRTDRLPAIPKSMNIPTPKEIMAAKALCELHREDRRMEERVQRMVRRASA